MKSRLWTTEMRGASEGAEQIVLFHHAGGSPAAFRPWLDELPTSFRVLGFELPGRDYRRPGDLMRSAPTIADAAAESIAPLLKRPTTFVGHSIGALIGFELIRSIRRRGGDLPAHLIVTGRRAPQEPPRMRQAHLLPDDAFVERLRAYGGTPEAVLRDRELMALFLPQIRADFAISETYAYRPEAALGCPITALAGTDDVTDSPSSVRGWGEHTAGGFRFHELPGGHFFVFEQQARVLSIIRDILTGAGPTAPARDARPSKLAACGPEDSA